MSEYTFIHIPRNGGTTIKRVINNLGISRTIAHDRHVWSKNIYVPPAPLENSNSTPKTSDRKIRTEVAVPYSPENIMKLVTHKTKCADAVGKAVVIIRDPIERVKSIYKYWKYGGEKNRRRKEKRGMSEAEKLSEATRKENRTPGHFIDMMESKEVTDENSNDGTFSYEYLLPQSYWVNLDYDKSDTLSSLIVIPYVKNDKEKIDHEDYIDNTDIVSTLYNIIKGSKTLKKRHHDSFKEAHVQLTEMKLNESSMESKSEKDEELFTESELLYFRMYYKSDYEMIDRLNLHML
jgi:hypothetical protein